MIWNDNLSGKMKKFSNVVFVRCSRCCLPAKANYPDATRSGEYYCVNCAIFCKKCGKYAVMSTNGIPAIYYCSCGNKWQYDFAGKISPYISNGSHSNGNHSNGDEWLPLDYCGQNFY